LAIVLSPVIDNYWCAQFEIPEYGRRFGFTMGPLQVMGADGQSYSELAFVSVDPSGVFGKAGVQVGDVPRMQHGPSSICAALGAAAQGYKIHLSLLNVRDVRGDQDRRREIMIDLPSQ
jgi:hypothetical protein